MRPTTAKRLGVAGLGLISLLIKPLLAQSNQPRCVSDAFKDLILFGGEILDITVNEFTNLQFGPETYLYQLNVYPRNITDLNVCEVRITYTHPGQNDTVTAVMWLPSPDQWNGRFLGVGGGGWATGIAGNVTLARPAFDGFAAISTDGGHSPVDPKSSPRNWGLKSPGNVDWALLQDFASIALDDAATLGKELVKAYYGQPPKHSYWSGCSTGGRQGYMMAQRYPDQYDGILATSPAINWNMLLMAMYWPQMIMNVIGKDSCKLNRSPVLTLVGQYPSQCELEAVRLAAVEACDSLDGAEDGIISQPGVCNFDPFSTVGTVFNCTLTGENVTTSEAAATIVNATWNGPVDENGNSLWYGLLPGSTFDVLANVTCANGTCENNPFSLSSDWISIFLARNPDFDLTMINEPTLARLLRQSVNIYESIIGTTAVDLTDFRSAGGKLLSWHGLADQIIPSNGTANYADRLRTFDPEANEYYRYFEAPGIAHCGTGPGWLPGNALDSLIDWVENGVAPEVIEAKAVPDLFKGLPGATEMRTANLCLYPKTMIYTGGDPNVATSFTCR